MPRPPGPRPLLKVMRVSGHRVRFAALAVHTSVDLVQPGREGLGGEGGEEIYFLWSLGACFI